MLYVLELCLLFIPIGASSVLKGLTATFTDAQLLKKKKGKTRKS